MSKKIYRIEIPMYGTFVNVVMGCTQREFLTWINKTYSEHFIEEDGDEGCSLYCRKDEKGKVDGGNFIWLRRFDWSTADQALLGHEIVHTAMKILEIIGTKVTAETEEPFAYLVQEIMVKIWRKLAPLHPVRKIKLKRKKRK